MDTFGLDGGSKEELVEFNPIISPFAICSFRPQQVDFLVAFRVEGCVQFPEDGGYFARGGNLDIIVAQGEVVGVVFEHAQSLCLPVVLVLACDGENAPSPLSHWLRSIGFHAEPSHHYLVFQLY